MTYTISPMNINDYPDALELWLHTEGMGLDPEDADSRDNTERYLRRNAGMSFVARLDGRLIGTVLCGHDGRRGYLHHLAVDDNYRKQGIGSTLVARSLAALDAEGITRCNIFVFTDNTVGHQFWAQRGWVAYSTITMMQAMTDGMSNLRPIPMTGKIGAVA